jgi:biopolymer transport protein ExbD
MRFPRQAKIFRGQLDAAPVAGVLFLLLIFLQISSLLYTPGVLVNLHNPAATIRIAKDGRIQFDTNFFTAAQTNELRAALQNSAAGPPFDLQADPATPPAVAARARAAVNQIFLIHPPAAEKTLIGTDNPTVMVRVNFLGQYIYDNHVAGEQELKAGLTLARQAAARESKELTLTIAGDEQVKWDALTRLAQWAREVGIKDTILAEWIDKPAVSPAMPVP